MVDIECPLLESQNSKYGSRFR